MWCECRPPVGITALLAACQEVSSISRKSLAAPLHEKAFGTGHADNPAVLRTFESGAGSRSPSPVLRHERLSFSEH